MDPAATTPDARERARLQRLLGAFDSFVGHDLANALVSINAYTRLLADAEPGDEMTELLTRLGAAGSRLADRSRRLVEIGCLLRGPVWGPSLPLAEAAHEATAEVRSARGGDVPCRIPEGLPSLPLAGPLLRRVLVELIANAAAACPSDIEITGSWSDAGGTVGVRDDGKGVQPGRATGLGLLVAEQAATLWGGTLSVQSRQGGGTEAVVTISAANEGCA